MKKMSKIAAVAMATMMTMGLFTGCGTTAVSTNESADGQTASADSSADASGTATVETKDAKIGVISMIENGAFMNMKEGVVDTLEDAGYTNIDYKCAGGDTSSLQSIVASMTDGSYDLIVTIATPATQAVVNAESDTPNVFCAVSSPVAAGVISDLDHPDKNATGTSNAIPVSEIIDLAQATTPVEKYGLISSGNEDNATNTISQCKEYLDSEGIAYVEKTASTANDIETAVNALIEEGAEAIFIPNDSIIQDGISTLVDICKENKIPTYCSSATTVESGCFATLAIDDYGIGQKTANMAIQVLEGTAVEDIPTEVVGIDYCSVNKEMQEALGITEIKTDYELNEIE
jgi:putative tryptophan/tyrosine transport system substrate-binding protein